MSAARSSVSERVRSILVRPLGPLTEAELDQQGDTDDRERYRDSEREQVGMFACSRQVEHQQQIEKRVGSKECDQNPIRHVAVVRALNRHGELRIGEDQIDNGTETVALKLGADRLTG